MCKCLEAALLCMLMFHLVQQRNDYITCKWDATLVIYQLTPYLVIEEVFRYRSEDCIHELSYRLDAQFMIGMLKENKPTGEDCIVNIE